MDIDSEKIYVIGQVADIYEKILPEYQINLNLDESGNHISGSGGLYSVAVTHNSKIILWFIAATIPAINIAQRLINKAGEIIK